jgi:uncharacterized protein (DUF924 family)
MRSDDIIHFWFSELSPQDWFTKSDVIDHTIRERFFSLYERASRCELAAWRETAEGALAEIIVLDQFSRNLFRDSPRAFSCDAQALALAQEAIQKGFDAALKVPKKTFLYLPFMHSESAVIHKQAVDLFNQEGMENNYEYELMHKEIVDRFGRYPHRNATLGRESTEEELEFLKGHSGF